MRTIESFELSGINTKKRLNDFSDKVTYEINNERVFDIPIISVTGTNGKTTTVRLIHTVLRRLGYISGLASTGGIFIGNDKIMDGDTKIGRAHV
mgnify:FL=1